MKCFAHSLLLLPLFPTLAVPAAPAHAGPQEEQEDVEAGPTKEQVEAAVDALKAALKAREQNALVKACATAALVPHADVAALLADVLDVRVKVGEEKPVRRAALDALGRMGLPSSLKTLHKAYEKKKKTLRKDQELATALLRAIAAHEDPSSIEVLIDDVESTPGVEALRARILGLARIRTNASLEALLKLMNRVTKWRDVRQIDDFRLALAVLTGVDRGVDATAWMQWWNDAKKSFEVSAEQPLLPKALDTRWRRYWGLGKAPRRGGEREDRGGA